MKIRSLVSAAFGKSVALVTGIGIVLGGAILPAVPAAAITTQLVVPVVDSSGNALQGVLVKACEFVSGVQQCVEATSDSNGDATLSPTLSSPNAYLSLLAGGPTTSYSTINSGVSFTNSVASNIPTLAMSTTTWSDVVVTVLDSGNSNAPIANEQVSLTTTYQGSPRSEYASTNSSGAASFRVDNTIWSGTITASIGGNQSRFVSNSGTVSNGLLQLSTTILDYSLSGVVTFNNSAFANKAMSLGYSSGSGSSYSSTCIDFVTNSSGQYSVAHIASRNTWINSRSCNDYSASLFDTIPGFIYDESTIDQTYDFTLTRTGVDLTVTEAGTSNSIPGLEVTLTGTGQYADTRVATTDQNGVAHFYGLESGEDYTASYSRNQWDTSRLQLYEEKTNSSTVTVGAVNTVEPETLVLSRLLSAPATPVSISGKIVTGVSNTAVANARVSVSWSNTSQQPGGYRSLNYETYTDASGNYSVGNLPFGRISVNITANGYRQTYFSIEATEGQTSYPRGNLNLRPTIRGDLTYSGVLKDANNNVIPGMRLSLSAMGTSGSIPVVTTGNDGSFSFTNLTEGIYYLSADVWSSDSIYLPFNHTTSFVDLTTSQTNVQIALATRTVGAASASGHVAEYVDVNGPSSATPLEGKTVYIWPQNGGQGFLTQTDANGDWSISGLPNNQQYMVSVQYEYGLYEYSMQQNSVTAKTIGGVPHQLLLKKISAGTGSLTGRVKNAANYSNIAGMQVNLYRSLGGVSIPATTTDTRGEYSFSNLPAGEYYLFIGDQGQTYKDAYMAVEIGSGSNRINALLTQIASYAGSITGTVLDERGVPLANANVEVWDPNDSNLGGWAQTNNDGEYVMEGVPLNSEMNFRVSPTWDLRYEVASYNQKVTLDNSNPTRNIDVQLTAAAFISGKVSGIPTSGNVPTMFAELIDASTSSVVAVTWVNSETGLYTFASVPAGNYLIRYTQRGNYQGYTGNSGGGGFGGVSGEVISLKPVYWDGTTLGTADISQAGTVSVSVGGRVTGKSVTVSRGSSITGVVTVTTPDGESKLTGTRAVLVYVYKKQANGSWVQIGYPEGVNGYTDSEIKIAGLAAGSYKLKFEDSRRGNNSLETVYNGNASTLSAAPEIVVGEEETVTTQQSMAIAAPERSAEAFDLDDLGTSQLSELENQISVDTELNTSSVEPIYVGVEFAGEYVAAFANSTPTSLGGWKQVDSNGYISVVIPASLETGSHRIAVQDANLQVIGWSAVTIAGAASEPTATSRVWKKSSGAATSQEATTKTSPTKSGAPKVDEAETVSKENADATQNSPNFWIFGGLAAVLAAGIAGGVWLIRSRRS